MRSLIYRTFVILGLTIPIFILAEESFYQKLSLKEAEEIALKNAYPLKIERTQLQKEHSIWNITKSALYPKIMFGLNYDHYRSNPFEEGSTLELPFSLSGMKTASVNSSEETRNTQPPHADLTSASMISGNVGIRLPIDLFGTGYAAIKSSECRKKGQELNYSKCEKELLKQVRIAFHGTLIKKSLVDVHEKVIRIVQKRFNNAQEMFYAGAVSKLELLNSKVELKKIEMEVFKMEHEYKSALEKFKLLIGVTMDTPLLLEDTKSSFEKDLNQDMESITLQKVLDSSYELKNIEYQLKALNYKSWNDLQTILPSVSIHSAFNGSMNSVVEDAKSLMCVSGLTINIPIYDGGLGLSKSSETRCDQAMVQLKKEQLLASLKEEYRDKKNKILLLQKKLAASEEALHMSEESMKISEMKYDEGVINIVDFMQAEADYLKINIQYNQAKTEIYLAWQELINMVGDKIDG